APALILLTRTVAHALSLFHELLARIDEGFVLGHAGDDVVPLLAVHLRDARDRQIVRFRGAAREYHFLGARANQIRHLLASVLHRFLGFPTERVIAARSVAELLREVRKHR